MSFDRCATDRCATDRCATDRCATDLRATDRRATDLRATDLRATDVPATSSAPRHRAVGRRRPLLGVTATVAAGAMAAAGAMLTTAAPAAATTQSPNVYYHHDWYIAASYASTPSLLNMPSATTTGVPAGTVLHPHGSITVTRSGTVINAAAVTGTIDVRADNVTIENTKITTSGQYGIISRGRNLLVRDVEVAGSGCHVAIAGSNMRVLRAKLHGCVDGVRIGSYSVVRESYIYGLYYAAGGHNDGIQSTGGRNMVIFHNTISNPSHQTSAILLKADLAPISNAYVVANSLNGGCYTVYALKASYSTSVVSVSHNRFGRAYLYGLFIHNVPVTWTGNR